MAKTRGVFAIINNEDGRLLISERADGKGWNLPGGGVNLEKGETDQEALVREVKEETGLDIEVFCIIGVPLKFKDDIAVAYRCQVIGGLLTATQEAKSHRYVSSEETDGMIWAGRRTRCLVLTSFYV